MLEAQKNPSSLLERCLCYRATQATAQPVPSPRLGQKTGVLASRKLREL